MQFRFFPVVCFSCIVVASFMSVSLGSYGTDQGFVGASTTTLEAFAMSRALFQLETWELQMDSMNITERYLFSWDISDVSAVLKQWNLSEIWSVPAFLKPLTSASIEQRKGQSFSRQHNVAFHPVLFDDMFSIDKRGNTLHYVDDTTSVARKSFPILHPVRQSLERVITSAKHIFCHSASI